jgi:hypothetical protein
MEKKQNSRDWQQFFGKDPLQHLSGTNSKNGDKMRQEMAGCKQHQVAYSPRHAKGLNKNTSSGSWVHQVRMFQLRATESRLADMSRVCHATYMLRVLNRWQKCWQTYSSPFQQPLC